MNLEVLVIALHLEKNCYSHEYHDTLRLLWNGRHTSLIIIYQTIQTQTNYLNHLPCYKDWLESLLRLKGKKTQRMYSIWFIRNTVVGYSWAIFVCVPSFYSLNPNWTCPFPCIRQEQEIIDDTREDPHPLRFKETGTKPFLPSKFCITKAWLTEELKDFNHDLPTKNSHLSFLTYTI